MKIGEKRGGGGGEGGKWNHWERVERVKLMRCRTADTLHGTQSSYSALMQTAVFSLYQLFGHEWHVLNDGQSDSPLSILRQFYDGRKKRLRQLADTNHCHSEGGRREKSHKVIAIKTE